MMQSHRAIAPYAAALAIVVVSATIRLPLWPWLQNHAPFLTIYPAVTLAAVLWGKRVGIVAGLAGFLAADLLFVEPHLQVHFTPPSLLAFIVIVATAAYIGHIGDRLRNARDTARSAANALAESERQVAAELNVAQRLHQVSTNLIQADNVEALYEQILDTAVAITHADFASLQMLHPERGTEGELELLGHRGFSAQAADFWQWVRPTSRSTCGLALRGGERVVVPDITACEAMAGSDDLEAYLKIGVRAVQTTPLLSRSGAILGMVSTHWRELHEPTASELRALDMLARQAADLIERKRNETALRESEQHARRIIDNTLAFVGVMTPDGTLLEANATALRAGGMAREEVVGRKFWDCSWWSYDPDVQQQLREAVDRAVGGEIVHYDVVVRMAGDSRMPIDFMLAPVRNSAGQVVYLIPSAIDITERKQAEKTLRQSESFYRQTIDSIPGMVFTTRPDGYCDYQSQQWVDYTGVPLSEHLGDGWNKLLHPDDRPRAFAAWRAAVEGRAPYDLEYRVRRHDGEYEWFKVTGRPICDASGQIVRWFGTALNIHHLIEAQAAQRESERQLALAIKAGRSGTFEWDIETNTGVWSEELLNLYGVEPAGFGGRDEDWTNCLIPEDREIGVAAVRRSLETGEFAAEFRIRRRTDGEIRWMKGQGQVLFDKQGKPTRMVGINIDITESKRAEERMRLLSEVAARLLASEQPQEIVESLCRKVMAHLDCHAFFNFLVAEEAGRLRLNACAGIPNEAAREIEWLDYGVAVCGCAARDRCRIVAERIQTTDDPRTNLVRSYGIQAYACHPLMDQGRVIGTLSFGSRSKPAFNEDELSLMRAVTDLVSIAMQKIRLMQSLEKQVEAAEAANVAKSQFLANMSHELRTPMNAILGMIDVALPKAVDPAVQDCLKTAKGSADLLLTLLNDLLDSAKIESGKLELESAPFSLRRVLSHLTQVLAVRTSEKGLIFCCHIPEETPDTLVGDRTRLQQVLLNLANNAVKFTERGEVEIRLRACPLPHAGEESVELEFAVRDTGIGIPASKQDRLFDRFSQADPSVTRRFGGTGLGLSICKDLVEMMGGRIWVESEEGKGSVFRFTVRLPLAEELPDDFDSPLPVLAAARCPLNILLVEDNPANQKLASYVLRDRGHQVEIAGDGAAAVERTGQNRYDVVLMDVQMPGMDGLAATAAIRQRENGDGRVPIIAMTAHAMPGDRERCLEAGMDGYLSKPINAREMIALVECVAHRESPAMETALTAHSPTAIPAEPPAQSAVVFDREEALMRCSDDPEILQEMIQCYFDEVDLLFPQMRAALEKGDLVEVGRLGHRLKGTVVYLGAQPAKEAALRVEHFERNAGEPAEAQAAVDALWHACSALKSALLDEPPGA